MAKNNSGTIIVIGLAAVFAAWHFGLLDNKRAKLIKYANETGTESAESRAQFVQVLKQMTDAEINDVYELIFVYKSWQSVPPGPLQQRLLAISSKYNIFT